MPVLGLLLFLNGCKEPQPEGNTTGEEIQFFSFDSLPQRVVLNEKASEIAKGWLAINYIDTGFDALSTVENREDLILVLEDLVDKQKQLEAADYPEEFDLPQVKSRQKVMKTFILNTRAAADYRIDATPAAIEMMKAYNALRAQLNVIANNTLNIELISDE